MSIINSKLFRRSVPAMVVVAFGMTGCGGSGGSDGSDGGDITEGTRVAATVVDPYVEGAIFCVDTNRNKSCDDGEPRSTASTAGGEITFDLDEPLPANSLIVADTSSLGTHNGVDFTLEMAAMVGEGSDGFVISPMTTLQARTAPVSGGAVVADQVLTDANIVELLQAAGLSEITAADISSDPMENVSNLSGSVTNAELARIQAALSVYGFMRLFNESDALNSLSPDQILASGLDTDGSSGGDNGVYQILSGMVMAIKSTVSPELIVQAQAPIDAANVTLTTNGLAPLPNVTAEVIVKAGVAILDRVVGDAAAACNAASGSYAAGLTAASVLLNDAAFPALVDELGASYYGAHNKGALQSLLNSVPMASDMTTLMGEAQQGVWLDLGMGCASGHFSVDASLGYSCVN